MSRPEKGKTFSGTTLRLAQVRTCSIVRAPRMPSIPVNSRAMAMNMPRTPMTCAKSANRYRVIAFLLVLFCCKHTVHFLERPSQNSGMVLHPGIEYSDRFLVLLALHY